MDARETRGRQIAQTAQITETPKGYIVPSQYGNGSYLVYQTGREIKCTCPDCKKRGLKCKHQFAVDYFMKQETDEKGNVTITKGFSVKYPRDWHNYNTAQNKEVEMFSVLLRDLLENVEEPSQSMGRPRLSKRESIFCAIEKVYSQLSSRRAHTLYREAKKKGQIGKAPNFNAVNKVLNRKDMTPILHKLLALSALPLKGLETQFAVDSSGFRTSRFNQYAVEKYGRKKEHKWVKAHIIVGTKTNVIVGAKITENNINDSTQFIPLVREADESGFDLKEISADKAYSGRRNMNFATEIGAMPYIPFKSSASGKSRASPIWRKMYHMFELQREEFDAHYHARSNVETTFMMVKTKFGEKLKSKKRTSQQNELLCKFIAHNIVCVVHEMMELKIGEKNQLNIKF